MEHALLPSHHCNAIALVLPVFFRELCPARVESLHALAPTTPSAQLCSVATTRETTREASARFISILTIPTRHCSRLIPGFPTKPPLSRDSLDRDQCRQRRARKPRRGNLRTMMLIGKLTVIRFAPAYRHEHRRAFVRAREKEQAGC